VNFRVVVKLSKATWKMFKALHYTVNWLVLKNSAITHFKLLHYSGQPAENRLTMYQHYHNLCVENEQWQ